MNLYLHNIAAASGIIGLLYMAYRCLDRVYNEEYDMQNYAKFTTALKDIKANGILNAYIKDGKTNEDAISEILAISQDVKKHSAQGSYHEDLLKKIAENISEVKYTELEARQDIYKVLLYADQIAMRYMGSYITFGAKSFMRSVYTKHGVLDYAKLDMIISQGNDDWQYNLIVFDTYSIHNSIHIIEETFAEMANMNLDEQILEMQSELLDSNV